MTKFDVGRLPIASAATAFLNYPAPRLSIELAELGALHVVGSPGEGKSTFLGRLADACIAEDEGVLLIDPKGDLAVDLAERTEHPDKLIYVSPGAYDDRFFTLNVMEVAGESKRLRDIVSGNVVKMFEHLGKYDAAFMTLVGKYLVACVQSVE
jgi:hypothetical protein